MGETQNFIQNSPFSRLREKKVPDRADEGVGSDYDSSSREQKRSFNTSCICGFTTAERETLIRPSATFSRKRAGLSGKNYGMLEKAA
ncbi:MAG: hypothetical protein ACOZAM_18360 [Pseudomonadota bacterium]